MKHVPDDNAESHNPFAAPQIADIASTANPEEPRPTWLILFLIFQTLCYAAFVLVSGMAAIAALGGLPILIHEVVLLVVALAFSPIVGWFGLVELKGVVRPMPGRERVLARFSMWTTIVPIAMALLWIFEFAVHGDFRLNAVPAFLSVIFASGWFLATTKRYLLSRKRSHRSPEDVAAEILAAVSRRNEISDG